MDALIGWTGYVGSTLLAQRNFDRRFRSTDIGELVGSSYRSVVCAGAPAQKWIADSDPATDRANIEHLASMLDRTNAERFVLISTVDVFADSRGATEATLTTMDGLSPYGANRLWLEQFVEARFTNSLVVRLPGLVGPGLRKNAVFDLRNQNNLEAIDAHAVYQFYPMVNLSDDIAVAERAQMQVVHLVAAPLAIAEVAASGFGIRFDNEVVGRTPPHYDLRTQHAELFGGVGDYMYSRRESLLAIRAYAQSEPRSNAVA